MVEKAEMSNSLLRKTFQYFLAICVLLQCVSGVPLKHYEQTRRDAEQQNARQGKFAYNLSENVRNTFNNQQSKITCDACKLAMDVIRQFVEENRTNEEIIDYVTDLCVSLGLETEGVCRGMLEEAIVRFNFLYFPT